MYGAGVERNSLDAYETPELCRSGPRGRPASREVVIISPAFQGTFLSVTGGKPAMSSPCV